MATKLFTSTDSDLILEDVLTRIEESKQLTQVLTFPCHELHLSKARQLYQLISSVNDYSPYMASSVVDWIHASNRIEFAGFKDKSDTEATLLTLPTTTQQEREVTQTFQLLKETYTDNKDGREFDHLKILKWHQVLCFNLLQHPDHVGAFRTLDVKVRSNFSPSGEHIFPHHTVVQDQIQKLCRLTFQVQRILKKYQEDPVEALLWQFALAGFVQFHFVHIHPFVDGNGRMCRFLSKYILDAVCPVPFPMFKVRDVYFETLEVGRILAKSDALLAPRKLIDLLLTSAIEHYEHLLYQNQPPIPAWGVSATEIAACLPQETSPDDLERLRAELE